MGTEHRGVWEMDLQVRQRSFRRLADRRVLTAEEGSDGVSHDASSHWAYLVRMEQTKRKARWITSFDSGDLGAPVIQGEFIVVNKVEVSKVNGAVRQD